MKVVLSFLGVLALVALGCVILLVVAGFWAAAAVSFLYRWLG